MNEDGAKRRGRPPKSEDERKTGNLTFRTRGGLRSQLEDAAKLSGRSVSEEIEHRLELSFDRNAVALQIYGVENTDLIAALCSVLNSNSSNKTFSAPAYLAAITSILAVSGSTLDELITKNVDPSVWLFLSQAGIARACGLDIEEATKAAERVVPPMAAQMAEFRAGAEVARRLKKERSK